VKADTFDEESYYRKRLIRQTRYWDSIIPIFINRYKSKFFSEEKVNQRMKELEEDKKSYTTKESIMGGYACDSLHRVFRYISPVDSEMGYLQYLFLYVMGEQFAYLVKQIIYSRESVQFYLDYYKDIPNYHTEKFKNLLNIDLSPKAMLTSEDCSISWYEIELSRVVFKRSYSIQRHPPSRIKRISSEKIVEIDNDIIGSFDD
jgi:hypothetical protein